MSFWRAIFNNVKWTILFLTIPAIMALVIASLLLTRKRSHGVYQIIFLLPYALSPIANAFFWRYMIFDHVFGVAGYVEKHISWATYPLGHVYTALYAVATMDSCHCWGYLTLDFFA